MRALGADTTYKFSTFTDDAADLLNFPDSTYTLTSTQFAAVMAEHLRKYPLVESIAYMSERAEYDTVLNTLPTHLTDVFRRKFAEAAAKHREAMLANMPSVDRKAAAALFDHAAMVQIASGNVHTVPATVTKTEAPKTAPTSKPAGEFAVIGGSGVRSYEAGKGSVPAETEEEEAPWAEEKAPVSAKRATKAPAKAAAASTDDADEKALILELTTSLSALKFDSGAAVTSIEVAIAKLTQLADFYDAHQGTSTRHQEWLMATMLSVGKFKKSGNVRASTPGVLVLIFRDDTGAEVEAELAAVQPKGDKAEVVEMWKDSLMAASSVLVGNVGSAEDGGVGFDIDVEDLLA